MGSGPDVAARNRLYSAARREKIYQETIKRRAALQTAYRNRQSPIYRTLAVQNLGEIRSLDIAKTAYGMSSTAVVTCLNLIRVGSSFFNRLGRKIEMKSLHLKARVTPIRTIDAEDYARVIVVYDAQTNGANPAVTDVIQDTDQAGTNTTTAFSSANLNNRERFKILADWRLVLPSHTNTAGVITNIGMIDPVEPSFDIERYIKLKGLVTMFKADTAPAVVGDIATGGLFLITMGVNTAGTEGYELSCATRLRWYDK